MRGVDRRRRVVHRRLERSPHRLAAEGRRPGEELVDDDAQGEDVRPLVRRLGLDLLRRHVAGRADEHARTGERSFDCRQLGHCVRGERRAPGDAEVEYLDAVVRRDHDVSRLEIAVDDALRVRGGDGGSDPGGVGKGAIEREPGRGNGAIERHAGDVLHDEEVDAAVLLDGVDRDAVRVIERRRGARFAEQAAGRFRIGRRRQHLDRDRPIQHRIAGAIDRPHPAFTQARVDGVVQEGGADHEFMSGLGVRGSGLGGSKNSMILADGLRSSDLRVPNPEPRAPSLTESSPQ